MRTVRIYQPGQYQCGQVVELSPEAAQHVAVVLRMRAGEKLTLFSGNNIEFTALIATIQKKKVTVTIMAAERQCRESPRAIHLAQAISKGERMEFVVQKAVELGVASITPLLTARCVVKLDAERLQKKRQQWQAIAVAACEQCGRNVIPKVYEAEPLEKYVQQCQSALKLVLYPDSAKSWREYEFKEDIALLIGPEGGLDEHEIAAAQRHGFSSLRLGPRILRTETAAITALSVLQAVSGDL
ncbi:MULTISPECIES: 16S rRNA (uracil(1498)-N(3))-methyltransferase [Legionella]|uniref:Ribosomal RNA small subunit methyltransferase E n=1 Tax=Legionella septentrionalis TaxID=2498109 RepID=A0A3S0V5L3_9GAMM|nr:MULTISPECIES: 16S rRNA (uracil(1498)-N(3))-methyltransferase [Legionella]MCP0912775.1 16S rRNA (uracil(1498)-N(3))-methyltransferase [Legionella sp. 27cVA30]RUQ88657.1 16S rRNA (uracil(1498)-N(3))-methyltransferase [Legionella septentrionalis]RUQ97059.1 16S rRNA (uracil(1498)-N(3))-methyltransferase [Legionella septentrionalis]RUR11276.1 16S rRNA (uracil(1498)-N(3))-methyltransferase [Legionella septentrionalis]RUR16331.1 16S rRNA (uracil(1498)-N(3))-methyltransferase [Legionella septentrio